MLLKNTIGRRLANFHDTVSLQKELLIRVKSEMHYVSHIFSFAVNELSYFWGIKKS